MGDILKELHEPFFQITDIRLHRNGLFEQLISLHSKHRFFLVTELKDN